MAVCSKVAIAVPLAALLHGYGHQRKAFGTLLATSLMLGHAAFHWLLKRPFSLPLRRQPGLKRKLRVAIIGAGIGGSALACWLRDLYGEDVELTVISDSPVGGRCRSIVASDGNLYEGGASIISDLNEYIMGFMRRFGLKEKGYSLDVPLGLFGSEGVFFREADPMNAPLGMKFVAPLQSMLRLLSRYGFFGLRRLKGVAKHRLAPRFPGLYKALGSGVAFQTLGDLLDALGPRVQQLTKHTATSWLTATPAEGPNVPDNIVHELATAGMRSNYGGQTCDNLHAFVGVVSCAGGFSSRCFAIRGGNQQVPKRLMETACPDNLLIGWTARSLQRSAGPGGSWKVAVERTWNPDALEQPCAEAMKGAGSNPQASDPEARGAFDIVVLAHPLARSCLNVDDIIKEQVKGDLGFCRCTTHFVRGVLRPEYFSMVDSADKAPPLAVLTIAGSSAPFYSIGLQIPVDCTEKKSAQRYLDAALRGELAVFKVFAPRVLAEAELQDLFANIEGEVKVHDWYAYPEYDLLQTLPSFVLNGEESSLLYLNAIEDAASAMEMSVIAARNAANLVVRYVEQRRVGQPQDIGF